MYFNDAAGELLGLRYEEAGPMSPQEWGTRFDPVRTDGTEFPVEELPLTRALTAGLPAEAHMRIRSAAGADSDIAVVAFPITGTTGTHGALAIFWRLGDAST